MASSGDHQVAFQELQAIALNPNSALSAVEETLVHYISQYKTFWLETFQRRELLCLVRKCKRYNVIPLLAKYGANMNSRVCRIQSIEITLLDYAIDRNNVDLVRTLLNRGCDVNTTSCPVALCSKEHRRTPLANINSCWERTSPLQLALLKDSKEIVELLLQRGVLLDQYSVSCLNFRSSDRNFHRRICKFTPLHIAVHSSTDEIVRILLSKVTDPVVNMYAGDESDTVLTIAVWQNRSSSLVKLLLERGADVNAIVRKDRHTALHIAVELLNQDLVDVLLEREDIRIDARDGAGMTPLAIAVKKQNVTIVRSLLARGADPNAKVGQLSQTALHLALKNGCNTMVRLLLQHHADVNLPSDEGNTPVFLALKMRYCWSENSKNRHTAQCLMLQCTNAAIANVVSKTLLLSCAHFDDEATMQVVVDRGADVDARHDFTEQTALHIALSRGNLKTAQFLLERKADLSSKDGKDKTALHYAAQSVKNASIVARIIDQIIDQGLDLNARTRGGKTALHVAAEFQNVDFARTMLLRRQVNVNAIDIADRTPLHYVASSEDQEMARLLIANGCRVNAVNCRGETVLHAAIRSKNHRFVQFLLSEGADVNRRNFQGEPVFHLAMCFSDIHHPIFEMLLIHGADIDCRNHSDESTAICKMLYVNHKQVGYFLDFNPSIGTIDQSDPRLRKHVVKMYLVGHTQVQEYRNFESEDSIKFREKCEKEVQQMKAASFFQNVTYYDLLTGSDKAVARFVKMKGLRNIVFRIFLQFRLYGGRLIVRIEEALVRNTLYELATRALRDLFGFRMPDLVIDVLLAQLKNRDLIELIKVYEYKELLELWKSEDYEEVFRLVEELSATREILLT